MTLKASNYPTVRPSLDLNFAQTKRLDPRITYSRASSGTYYDTTGLLKSAATNEARFDHDPVTDESLGLLVEEARTNQAQYSEHFDNAAWIKTSSTVTPNNATAPDGTFTTDKVTATTPSAYVSQGVTLTAATHTASIYAKADTATSVTLYLATSALALGASCVFDLSNGTAGSITHYGSSTGFSSSIQALAGGWYRCTITGLCTATTWYHQVGLLNNQNNSMYFWGAQLEAGAFPTSYIPTPATFTSRSTTATYYDANGVIQTAGINVARDDAYFPDENGVMRPTGLLLEAAGTNIKTNSQVFTSGWNTSGIDPITQNTSITTPEGLTDGVGVITESSGGTVHQVYSSTTVQYTGYYSYSIFVKPNGRNYVVLSDSTFTHNLSDGTTTGSPSGEFISAKTEKLPNGWYRCSLVRLHNNTFDQFNLKLADGPGSTSYSGDGVSGVYIWGAQQEVSTYPTSYIPTTSSTVTRAADVSSSSTVTRSADVAQITGSNFSSWFNKNSGTLLCNAQNISTSNGPNPPLILTAAPYYQGTGGYKLGLAGFWSSISQMSTDAWANGVNLGGSIMNVSEPLSESSTIKHSFAYSSTECVACVKQTLGTVGGSQCFQAAQGLDRLIFQQYFFIVSSRIARLTYYPVRLPDATLQTLTS